MSTNRRASITHVIFDMDGTLLDTEAVYTDVTQQIVSQYGKNFTWEIKAKMMGQRAPDAAKILVDSLNLPIAPEEYMAQEKTKTREMWPLVLALPGVEKLIMHLNHHKIPQGVATSSHLDYYQLKSQNKAWFSLFNCIVVGDDPAVKRGKPDPDIFLEAAKRLGIDDPSKVLVFEDAVNGVIAGKAAGMHVVAIPHPSQEKSLFSDADLVLNTMSEFDPAEWGLPPYDQE
eukprot:TRINITY_DN6468_c0_g1_i1.p1 TRINITY_DN6468_c0_g1~~TRINITY_DN6468_c0_g1_i1.p1  ORF type:complete len:253 (-),score=70.62 TRINITY_DN6468_c0_g1_i1:39-728(-)